MSPEQIQGAALADDRTDIWAMGVILYAAIAGREPFSGDTLASILIAVTTREPPPLNEVAPGVSPGLNAVIMRCLAKNPDHRLRSAQELYDALEPFETTGRQGATVNYSASHLPAPAPAAHAPTPSPVAMPSVEQLPAVAAAGHAPVSAGRQGTWALGENNPAIATDSWDLGRNQSPVGATMGDGPPIRRSKMGLWIAVGLGALAFGGVAVFLALRGPDEALANNANHGNDTTTGVDHVLVTGGLDQTSAPAVGGTTSAAADTSTQPVTTSDTPATTQTKEETKADDLPTAEPNGKDPVKPDRVKPKVDLKLVRDLGGGVYVPAKSEQMGTQSEAKSDCSRLKNAKYGGLRDWQLPSVSQLVSMMGRGQLAGASYWSNSSDGTADGGKFVRKLPGGSPSEGVKKVSDRNRYVCIAKK
jgi:serine/threonine-protein kinase